MAYIKQKLITKRFKKEDISRILDEEIISKGESILDSEYIKNMYAKKIENPQELGCSIISAEFVYKTFPNSTGLITLSKNPSFKDLHLPAKPLSTITDSMLPNFLSSLKNDWKTNPLFEPKFYTYKQITDPNIWREFNTKSTRNMSINLFKNISALSDDSQPFEPICRILLTDSDSIIL